MKGNVWDVWRERGKNPEIIAVSYLNAINAKAGRYFEVIEVSIVEQIYNLSIDIHNRCVLKRDEEQ